MNDSIVVRVILLVMALFVAFSTPVFAGDAPYSEVFTNYMSECANQQFSSDNQLNCMFLKAGLFIAVLFGVVFIFYTKLKPSSLDKVIKANRENGDD